MSKFVFSCLVSWHEKARFSLATYFQPTSTSNSGTKIQQHAEPTRGKRRGCAFRTLQTTGQHRKCREAVLSRTRGERPSGYSRTVLWNHYVLKRNSLGAVTPHRTAPLAPSAPLPPPPSFSHPLLLPTLSPTSSRNLSAPLMVFFALTLAKLDPKRNNKRRNGSS